MPEKPYVALLKLLSDKSLPQAAWVATEEREDKQWPDLHDILLWSSRRVDGSQLRGTSFCWKSPNRTSRNQTGKTTSKAISRGSNLINSDKGGSSHKRLHQSSFFAVSPESPASLWIKLLNTPYLTGIQGIQVIELSRSNRNQTGNCTLFLYQGKIGISIINNVMLHKILLRKCKEWSRKRLTGAADFRHGQHACGSIEDALPDTGTVHRTQTDLRDRQAFTVYRQYFNGLSSNHSGKSDNRVRARARKDRWFKKAVTVIWKCNN